MKGEITTNSKQELFKERVNYMTMLMEKKEDRRRLIEEIEEACNAVVFFADWETGLNRDNQEELWVAFDGTQFKLIEFERFVPYFDTAKSGFKFDKLRDIQHIIECIEDYISLIDDLIHDVI